MKALALGLFGKFDTLAPRERRLVAAALLGGTLLLGWTLGVEPALARARIAERGIAEAQVQRATLQAQLLALQAPARNPEVLARAELAALQQQLAQLGERFAALEAALVPPQRMSSLLEDMIGRRSHLRLLSLRTLPVTPVLERKAAEPGKEVKEAAGSSAAGTSAALYKHGVEIRLEGSYAELADYLVRLERSPQKLLWGSATLSAEQHPRLVLTLTVYTLSLDRAWLIV